MNVSESTGLAILTGPAGAFPSFNTDGGLIGALLQQQGDLSAVERFAQFHADAREPLQGRYYSALMPARPPGPGQQLGFEVDLDRCSGCKACVAACHTLNGLDDGESWRDVGLVIGGVPGLPVLQHVTSACHHCVLPACLEACPVDAFEKDAHTGIVRHLDDQCFGCQYCTMACPYDAPKFHAGKGIVRKCDMCSERLAVGEAPGCVQACPHEAIHIRVVDRADIVARAESGGFLPAEADPRYTLPATLYRTSRLVGPGELAWEDGHHLEPEHAHWPLIAMLVLTQLSVGGFAVELIALLAGQSDRFASGLNGVVSLGFGWAGLGASVLHLGRPLYAYRALIGIRHSWLSREVLAFGLFAALATFYVGLVLFWPGRIAAMPGVRAGLLAAVVASGSAGVACSVLVYHVVQRPFWRARYGGLKFAESALVLGLAVALATSCVGALLQGSVPGASPTPEWSLATAALGLFAASCTKLRFETSLVRVFARSELSPLRGTALLLGGALARPAGWRRLLGVVGGVVLPAVAVAGAFTGGAGVATAAAVLALLASIGGEMAERYLFFTAVVKARMPGGWIP